MPNVVIVGSGPIGLYLAIKLRQKGINVTVVDPRVGAFTRPGVLDSQVFQSLSTNTGAVIARSASEHIKDAERGLYKLALQLGVVFKQEKFSRLVQGGVEITPDVPLQQDEKSVKSEIRCDYVFDATGPARAVMHDVNQSKGENIFVVESVADNPFKKQFLAYVYMDEKHSALLTTPLPEQSNPLQRTLALEELRTKFGWPEFMEPWLYLYKLEKGKVSIYCDTPPGLDRQQEAEWLKAVLRLKTGSKDIDFQQLKQPTKYKSKPRFLSFTVDPKKVRKAIHVSDAGLPTVIPVGDAQIEPDYRLGIGIESGMNRVNALLSNLQVDDKMSVNADKYQEQVELLMSQHANKIIEEYNKRRKRIIGALRVAEQRYRDALLLTKDVAIQKIINAGLAENLFKQVNIKWAAKNIDLEKCHALLAEVLGLLVPGQNTLKNDAEAMLLKIAEKYRESAREYLKYDDDRLFNAEKYLRRGLEIYEKFFPAKKADIKILCSNLTRIAYEKRNYSNAIAYAEKGLKYADKVDAHPFVVNGMKYLQCLALLDQAIQPNTKRSLAQSNFYKASKIAATLQKIRGIAHADLSRVQNKLATCKKMLDEPKSKSQYKVRRLFSLSSAVSPGVSVAEKKLVQQEKKK